MQVCAEHGCPELSTTTRCPAHTKQTGRLARARYRRNRYGSRWPRIRRQALERDCWQCRWTDDDGTRCANRAEDVDHIVPFAYFADPSVANALDNLQALCKLHHGRKTAAEVRSRNA